MTETFSVILFFKLYPLYAVPPHISHIQQWSFTYKIATSITFNTDMVFICIFKPFSIFLMHNTCSVKKLLFYKSPVFSIFSFKKIVLRIFSPVNVNRETQLIIKTTYQIKCEFTYVIFFL